MGSDFNLQFDEYDYRARYINISDKSYSLKSLMSQSTYWEIIKNTCSKDTGNSQSLSNREPLSVFCIVQI